MNWQQTVGQAGQIAAVEPGLADPAPWHSRGSISSGSYSVGAVLGLSWRRRGRNFPVCSALPLLQGSPRG